MQTRPDILCIGSVLWDIIGRAPQEMTHGSDVGGRITRLPGGVALNIAMTLARFGVRPAVLSAIGRDEEGDALVQACEALGVETSYTHRMAELLTDQYMAIEGSNGVIAAIADAHSLEAVGDAILAPLRDGTLAQPDRPYAGTIALDGNLTPDLLGEIARSADFADADLRIAPASPGKALRLLPFVTAGRGTLYVNLIEAGLLCACEFERADDAVQGLLKQGAMRVAVTDGARSASVGDRHGIVSARPMQVRATRLTGAGDTFMAAHIVAELRGADAQTALEFALKAAARYVSGEAPHD